MEGEIDLSFLEEMLLPTQISVPTGMMSGYSQEKQTILHNCIPE